MLNTYIIGTHFSVYFLPTCEVGSLILNLYSFLYNLRLNILEKGSVLQLINLYMPITSKVTGKLSQY